MTDMAAHVLDQSSEAEGAQIVALARFLQQHPAPPAPPSQRRRRVVPIVRSEANAAEGTSADVFNAKIIRETVAACTTMDDPDLAEAVVETIAGLPRPTPAKPCLPLG
jgi:hypothetical protein